MGEDGDAEVAGDLHAILLDEEITAHLRDGTDDEDDGVGDEKGRMAATVGLGGVVDDFAYDAGKLREQKVTTTMRRKTPKSWSL